MLPPSAAARAVSAMFHSSPCSCSQRSVGTCAASAATEHTLCGQGHCSACRCSHMAVCPLRAAAHIESVPYGWPSCCLTQIVISMLPLPAASLIMQNSYQAQPCSRAQRSASNSAR
eukprot:3506-Heterococcus_DN1.PRE.2